jgi:hypothetical protein
MFAGHFDAKRPKSVSRASCARPSNWLAGILKHARPHSIFSRRCTRDASRGSVSHAQAARGGLDERAIVGGEPGGSAGDGREPEPSRAKGRAGRLHRASPRDPDRVCHPAAPGRWRLRTRTTTWPSSSTFSAGWAPSAWERRTTAFARVPSSKQSRHRHIQSGTPTTQSHELYFRSPAFRESLLVGPAASRGGARRVGKP